MDLIKISLLQHQQKNTASVLAFIGGNLVDEDVAMDDATSDSDVQIEVDAIMRRTTYNL